MRVADRVVAACAALGVRHMFGVDGANIEDVYDAAYCARARGEPAPAAVVAKHEFSAATMADGYARMTGIGVVLATSGGGAMNLVAGLAESFTSRIPVIALVGQPPTALEGHGAFQDTSGRFGAIDATRLFGQISRYCARVDSPAQLSLQWSRAVAAARSGGPAVLLLPKDVQQAESRAMSLSAPATRDTSARLPQELVDRIIAARETGKIVVLAGDQVARDDARAELCTLVRALDASVGVTPDAKDVYPARAAEFCGVSGVMGHPELHDAVAGAALCLVIGSRLTVTARPSGLDPARAISVGESRPFVDLPHLTCPDLAAGMTELSERCGTNIAVLGQLRPDAPMSLRTAASTTLGLGLKEAVQTISALLPAGCTVLADAGNTGAAVVHHLETPADGRFVVALGMGGMGYSFGAAIGAAFARGRTVVIAGDGSFFMHGMELHTAIEHALPLLVIVFNNNAHAMCVIREQLYFPATDSPRNRFRATRLGDGIAAMFPGIPSATVGDRGELADAVRRGLRSAGPCFIDVACDPDEMPPFAPFLKEQP
jgi:acetolactate synthase-1/2/3 large subunit